MRGCGHGRAGQAVDTAVLAVRTRSIFRPAAFAPSTPATCGMNMGWI